jgi:hypothetical protein
VCETHGENETAVAALKGLNMDQLIFLWGKLFIFISKHNSFAIKKDTVLQPDWLFLFFCSKKKELKNAAAEG